MPAAMLIDFDGNDAYEATFDWTQGAARMGHSLLIDRKGNESLSTTNKNIKQKTNRPNKKQKYTQDDNTTAKTNKNYNEN